MPGADRRGQEHQSGRAPEWNFGGKKGARVEVEQNNDFAYVK